jgi:hypothetical protein
MGYVPFGYNYIPYPGAIHEVHMYGEERCSFIDKMSEDPFKQFTSTHSVADLFFYGHEITDKSVSMWVGGKFSVKFTFHHLGFVPVKIRIDREFWIKKNLFFSLDI